MSRATLLEMCIFTLTALPEEKLGEVLPALTALAGPYADPGPTNDELNRCIHDCIEHHREAIERPTRTTAP